MILEDKDEKQLIARYRGQQISTKRRFEDCKLSPGHHHDIDVFRDDEWYKCLRCEVDVRLKDFVKSMTKCGICERGDAVLYGTERRCFMCLLETFSRAQIKLLELGVTEI